MRFFMRQRALSEYLALTRAIGTRLAHKRRSKLFFYFESDEFVWKIFSVKPLKVEFPVV